MKNVRRMISLLLAVLMVFALAACTTGGTEDPKDPQNPSSPSTPGGAQTPGGSEGGDEAAGRDFELPERPVDAMSGKTYTVIQHDEIENPFGYSQDSQMGVMVADRIAEVEALYGVTLEFSFMAYDTNFASQLQALQFSEEGADLVFAMKNAMLRHALGTGGSESLMTDLLTVDHIIDFWNMDKWGSIVARESAMAGGYFYGVTPSLWVDCSPLPYYQVVYNKDLLTLLEIPDLQEYWEKEEWDRDTMLDVITSFDYEADGAWGMTACRLHMIRSTFLTTGVSLVQIDKINADRTVDWSRGMEDPDVAEAFQWLKNALTNNRKYFNNGQDDWKTADEGSWGSHVPFNAGQTAMAVTRPQNIFSYVVTEGPENFGLITWAGYDANVLSGYLEQAYTVAIPVFAQNVEHSAFLMYDLFEGLGDVETYEDVIAYYRETYFESDLDMTFLMRDGVSLQYSYWPNGVEEVWTNIDMDLLTASSISGMVKKFASTVDEEIETHMVPNTVAIEAYRQNGYFE